MDANVIRDPTRRFSMVHRTFIRLVTLFTVLLASPAVAAGPAEADDFARRGWFVGVGGGVATDFLSELIKENSAGLVDITSTGTFNFRAGYRLLSWLALEGMYEGAYGYKTEVAGFELASLNTHSLLGNIKLIAPVWRFQPYFLLGVGAQYGDWDSDLPLDLVLPDIQRWDLVVRPALGLDSYVTKNWLLNLEIAPSIRVRDFGDIPSAATDNVSLTFSVGVQYRF
jgi:opacity protein-like surface antigen